MASTRNIFEQQIAKYARRIKKIEENPNPALLKSNKLLYQIWLDKMKRELKAQQEGRPFAHIGGGCGLRIVTAMGINCVWPELLGDKITGSRVKEYFDIVRGQGFPDDACDRVQLHAGISLSGDLPPPFFIYIERTECDLMVMSVLWVARRYKVPLYFIDTPVDQSWEAVEYVTEQMRDMVRDIEMRFGARLDEDKLRELQQREVACQAFMADILELGTAVPSPIAGRDAYRMPTPELDEDPRIVDYWRAVRDELRVRTQQGISPVEGEEKARLMWLLAAPDYADPFSFLEKRGIAIPLYEEGAGVLVDRNVGHDEQYGRKLTPLEEEAAICISGHWAGHADRRVNDIITACRKCHINGLVHFQLSGCPTCLGTARIVADKVEKELGILSLMIEGHCKDAEKYNQAEFEAQLEDFSYLCLAKKGAA